MAPRPSWAPALAWAAGILVLTSRPAGGMPRARLIPGLDKVVDVAMDAGPGRVMTPIALGRGTRWLVAHAALAAFAAGDEWQQRFVPGRSADPADWLADLAGVALGTGVQRARTRQEIVS